MRYGADNEFAAHTDAHYDVPGAAPQTKSLLTVLLYLNDDMDGGATRFWAPDDAAWHDVEPRAGRVLLFQQNMLRHSGDPVRRGIKRSLKSDVLYERTRISGPAKGRGSATDDIARLIARAERSVLKC